MEAEVDSLFRSSVLIMTTATTLTSTDDPTSVAKEKLVEPSPFSVGSSSAGRINPTKGVFLDLTGSDFLVGAIRTMVDEFAPLKFFASVRGMEHDQLFTEFNVEATRQMSLSAEGETNALRERNVILKKERNALDVKVTELETSAMSKERKLTYLNALVTFVKSQNDNLANRVHELEISSSGLQEKITVYENCMDKLEEFQDNRMKFISDKFDRLYADFVEMALHLEEKFNPYILTTISGCRWLLTHGMELVIANWPKYPEYLLSADDVLPAEEQPLPAAISPTSESPGYIADSELEMDPEEEDRDDEKSKGDSFEYPTSRGDGDADDDGDDFLEDDADDKDEEESSNSEDEEEEHLAPTVLAPALHSSIYVYEDFDQTEPFEEGETAATPPPSTYRVTARILFDHIYLCHFVQSQRASMALMRSIAPFTFILAPRSRTPPIGTPSLLPILLPTTSFPLPLLLPFTSCSESIPRIGKLES
nr:hypothetical protein [Tanacetum cinerariifolium]